MIDSILLRFDPEVTNSCTIYPHSECNTEKNIKKQEIRTNNGTASSDRRASEKFVNGNEWRHSTGISYGSDNMIQGIQMT